jgi:hypothetical protein
MADTPPIISGGGTPQPYQPYDATEGLDMGPWVSVNPESGPADKSGKATESFPDGPGPWKQT